MHRFLRRSCTTFLLLTLLSTSTQPAKAQIPTRNQVIGIGVLIAAIGAGIGIGVYFLVRKAPSITGCTASSPTGLTLQNEADQQTFSLLGDTSTLKPGSRLRIQGKKKKDASGTRSFLVEKLTKDYGPCKVAPAVP